MPRELITFEVEGQLFGLDVMAIREIRAWTPVTRLPGVPHYVSGVVNLRGTVLPVVDLAARLGWPTTEATPRHAIIVTQSGGQVRGLIERLRGGSRHCDRPILVLTTESSDEKKARARAAGATGWIVKPFDPEKLIAAVRRVAH